MVKGQAVLVLHDITYLAKAIFGFHDLIKTFCKVTTFRMVLTLVYFKTNNCVEIDNNRAVGSCETVNWIVSQFQVQAGIVSVVSTVSQSVTQSHHLTKHTEAGITGDKTLKM